MGEGGPRRASGVAAGDAVEVVAAQVDRDRAVPHDLVQRQLVVRATTARVRVLDGAKVVAEHARSFDRGQQIEDPAHIRRLSEDKHQAHLHRSQDRLLRAVPQARDLLVGLGQRGQNLGSAVAALLRLLDHYGYKRGADGYRTFPDGQALTINMRREPQSVSLQYGELWKRSLDKIGLRLNITVSNFADNLKAATECQLASWGAAWYADYPEAENFLQLLYGPNAGQGNHGCYQSAAFDALYQQFVATPPSAERNRLAVEMNRQMEADTPWALHSTRVRYWLVRPWVKGFKKHPILQSDWKYLDVEPH